MPKVVVIAHNLRSTYNVGSLLRTTEGLGVEKIFLTGYTPYPHSNLDLRLPHLAAKITKQIYKTSLGAEDSIAWEHQDDIAVVVNELKAADYRIFGLEQTKKSLSLPTFQPPDRIALILGREVEGLEPDVIALCDGTLEIPMKGKKESFNVVQAAAMALYHICLASS